MILTYRREHDLDDWELMPPNYVMDDEELAGWQYKETILDTRLTDQEQKIVDLAIKLNCVEDVCFVEDYDPDVGKVKPYLKPKCFVIPLLNEYNEVAESKDYSIWEGYSLG